MQISNIKNQIQEFKISKNILGIWFVILVLSGCATVELAPRQTVLSGPQKTIQPSRGLYHRVQKGQTLWRIARIYGVSIEEILMANTIADSTLIASGQSILIPDKHRALSLDASTLLSFNGEPRSRTMDSLNTGVSEDFIWPVKGKIVSGFGDKIGNSPSKGITLRLYAQSDIVASASGRVVFAEEKFRGYGKTIIISHPEGLMSVYASLSRILVKPGDYITRGMAIAQCGGLMHFQIRKGCISQNPYYYLSR
ncbi:MAG TPA: hypothetical protein DEA99_00510 [Candidatus Omnitrophica bacterium]|nr:hypothetical protein [Candidatus Omnitrophota bacterium]